MILGKPKVSKDQHIYRSILNQYERDDLCLSKKYHKFKFSDYLHYLDFSKKQEITEIRNLSVELVLKNLIDGNKSGIQSLQRYGKIFAHKLLIPSMC